MTTEQISALTPEQLRVAVAEAMGYGKGKDGKFVVHEGILRAYKPANSVRSRVPDYCQSLDALRPCLERLTKQQRHAFTIILTMEFFEMGWKDWRDSWALINATPEQLCRAFLKAVNP